MAASPKIVEVLERVGQRLSEVSEGRPLQRKLLVEEVAAECGCKMGSVLPSDHCYNRVNDGLPPDHTPMFVHEGKGLYRFIGKNAPYTGKRMHYPKGKNTQPRHVSDWELGVLTAR